MNLIHEENRSEPLENEIIYFSKTKKKSSSYNSSSFNSMFGIPLLMGNCLPVSGHSKNPSSTSIWTIC